MILCIRGTIVYEYIATVCRSIERGTSLVHHLAPRTLAALHSIITTTAERSDRRSPRPAGGAQASSK